MRKPMEKFVSDPFLEFESWSDASGRSVLPGWLSAQLAAMGVLRPSPIQQAVIPHALARRDIVGCAATGSGKTLCYVLPLVVSLATNPSAYHGIVLLPSRELALQVKEVFYSVCRSGSMASPLHNFRCQVLIGGEPLADQAIELHQLKPHIVIATPGRFAQILRLDATSSSPLGLHRTRFLVFDEADRLLASEFAPDIATITGAVPSPPLRQTFFFSATMSPALKKLASLSVSLSNSNAPSDSATPFTFDETAPDSALPSQLPQSSPRWKVSPNISQSYCFMPEQVKDCYLVHLLRSFLHIATPTRNSDSHSSSKRKRHAPEPQMQATGGRQVMVFVRSCKDCEEAFTMLAELQIPVCRLHSWMKQSDRNSALTKFRSGGAAVLVATDLAHRGLDIHQVQLVVQYNLPRTTVEYVHRVGRTGRNPAKSSALDNHAIALVDQFDVQILLDIENDLGVKISEHQIQESAVLSHLNDVVQARELAKLRLDESGFSEKLEVKRREKRSRAAPSNVDSIGQPSKRTKMN